MRRPRCHRYLIAHKFIQKQPPLFIAHKSIVAARDIKESEEFTEENLTVKRPSTEISPMQWDEVIGQVAQKYMNMKRMN